MRILTGPKDRFDKVAFSPTGTHLAAAGQLGVCLWPLSRLGRFRLLGRGVAIGIGFVAGRDCLVMSTGRGGSVVYNLADAAEFPIDLGWWSARVVTPSPTEPLVLLTEPELGGRVGCVEVAADGRPSLLWQAQEGRQADPVFSPAGDWFGRLAERADWQLLLSRPRTGEELRRVKLSAHKLFPPVLAPRTDSIVFLDSSKLIVATLDADPPTHRIVPGGRQYFTGVAFHPSGRYLAATNNDATVHLFDTDTWQVVRSFAWEIGRLRSVAFSADGMLAAAGSDTGRVIVWDFDL